MKKGVLITGIGSGIGLATARLLGAAGYGIVGLERTPTEAMEALLKEIDGAVSLGDLRDPAVRQAAVDLVYQRHGNLYALVNVAGMAPRNRVDLLDMSEDSYDEVMDVNLKSLLFLSLLCARRMIAGDPQEEGPKGAIVNISSMSAYTTSVSRGEYCISKAGVSMVTKLLADRLAGEDILVNEVRPGIIRTGMTGPVVEKYDKLIGEGLLPLARWGEPEDVAKAVGLLIDGQLAYTTGESLDVDGGFHIRRL